MIISLFTSLLIIDSNNFSVGNYHKLFSPKISIDPFNWDFYFFGGEKYKKPQTNVEEGNTLPNMKSYTTVNIRSLGMIIFKL